MSRPEVVVAQTRVVAVGVKGEEGIWRFCLKDLLPDCSRGRRRFPPEQLDGGVAYDQEVRGEVTGDNGHQARWRRGVLRLEAARRATKEPEFYASCFSNICSSYICSSHLP